MNRDQIQEALRRMGITPAGTNGDWVQASCPFASTRHERGTDRSASFGVKAGNQSHFHCFTCKVVGSFVDLPAKLNAEYGLEGYEEMGHDFLVAEASGMVIEAETYDSFEELKPLQEDIYGDLFFAVEGESLAYLESRGISQGTADRLGLGDWPEERYVMFPIRGFDRRLYGWTGRAYAEDVKPKVWNMKGVEKALHLLGAELCTCERPIVIVEGLMFYARLHEIGVQGQLGVDVVAIMGSKLSYEQADLLAQIGQPMISFLDNDKAGKEGMWGDEKKGTVGAVQTLSKAVRSQYVTYPGRVADPDDLSDAEILHMIESARIYARKRTRA